MLDEDSSEVLLSILDQVAAHGVTFSSSDVRENAEAVASLDTAAGVPVGAIAVSGLQLGDQVAPGSALAGQVRRTASRISAQVAGMRT